MCGGKKSWISHGVGHHWDSLGSLSLELNQALSYLYLLSGRGLRLRGGELWSESDSDTGLRGCEMEEVLREVLQLGTTGEDRGLGTMDIPDKALDREQRKNHMNYNY